MMSQRKFTLIELLVVVSIIAILAAILLPVLGQARRTALLATCISNQRQVYLGMIMYAQDQDDNLLKYDRHYEETGQQAPWVSYQARRDAGRVIDKPYHIGFLWQQKYVPDFRVFYCPIADRGSILGTRYQDNVDVDGEWSTHASSGYSGNKARAGYMFNALRYRKVGSYNHIIDTGTYDFSTSDRAPLMYDWIYDSTRTWHAPDWNMTFMDGSTRRMRSHYLYGRLLSGWVVASDNSRHAQALDYLLTDN